MILIYNVAIHCFQAILWLISPFHTKANAFVTGRKGLFSKVAQFGQQYPHPVWMHCASLGEFEQGRPVLEAIRNAFPGRPILLTFFSPSGFEIRKNYNGADGVFYLPIDTPAHARKFIALTQPALAIFVKYEFWYNYSHELHARNIPSLSISCIFRENQIFFKPWGGLFRKLLTYFTYFYAQNQESLRLLKTIGINNAALAGDTRFDRVWKITHQADEIDMAKRFKDDQKTFVVGSCWPEDLDILIPFINESQHKIKFIIAPHEISDDFLTQIETSLEVKTVRFSKAGENVAEAQVLLIDNIGLLARLYKYGEFAYVGGAFGKGLHNILEAACYGVPVFFGNRNYRKFQEANDLILRGGAFELGSYTDLKERYEMLNENPENFLLACEVTKQYVQENLGATQKIMNQCHQILSQ